MDGGSGLFGGGGMFSGLGGQPTATKASTNVFGTVQQPSGYHSVLLYSVWHDLYRNVI